MKLSDKPSLKELYKYSCEEKKDFVKSKDYITIIIASTLSGATSWVLSKYDFAAHPFSGNLLIDVPLGAFAISLLFFIVILISLKLVRFVDRLLYFSELVWKKWHPFSKSKN